VTGGPFSIYRHPLYHFSTLGVVRFRVIARKHRADIGFSSSIWRSTGSECGERGSRFRVNFGRRYLDFTIITPAIFPAIGNLHVGGLAAFDEKHPKSNFWDPTVVIFLIPLAEIIDSVQEASWIQAVPVC